MKPRKVNTVSAELCLTRSAPRTCIDLRLGSYNRVLRGGSLARGVALGVDGIVVGDSGVGDEGRGVIICVGSERAVGNSTLPNSSNNDVLVCDSILGSDTARASPGRGDVTFVFDPLSG